MRGVSKAAVEGAGGEREELGGVGRCGAGELLPGAAGPVVNVRVRHHMVWPNFAF